MPDKIREAFDGWYRPQEKDRAVELPDRLGGFEAGARWAIEAAAARLEEMKRESVSEGYSAVFEFAADAVRKLGSES